MIPYGHQSIDKKDISQVVKVLKSDWLTQGPKILEFERSLAKYCGAKYAVAVTNGTAALHLSYLAAGIGKGDKVITSPNTFVATTNMLLVLGAKPVFADIRLDTYNLDENKLAKLITRQTKAIVPVHFAGQACEMATIHKIAKKHKLMVIEDASHGLGGKYHGGKIGNCRYSDMAIFSFHPVKSITTGEGGAILTNNKKLYQRMLLLRTHGIITDNSNNKVMVELGYNYRLTDMQASLGTSQLKKVDGFVKQRQIIAKQYAQEFKNFKAITLPQQLAGNYSAWHLYVPLVKNSWLRDLLTAYLKKNGVGVNFHYPAVYSHPYYKTHGYGKIKLINEDRYHQTCLTLPCYPGLKTAQIKKIANLVKEFFS
ncbi:MAG: UDP-4-amino-4,6-dideoxy-N-acetyl-beta-L-altrosamine transaminase [Candidatus Komeilibacteria bacterium]|nr:UDP-4-amino-4,6-dideoxy-N-acetyl-beta-L-altrosamine transaminase [Candidatus Komeilibacteria bacterium]